MIDMCDRILGSIYDIIKNRMVSNLSYTREMLRQWGRRKVNFSFFVFR